MRTDSILLKSATSVCSATDAVTPGLSGIPNVAAPDPALIKNESAFQRYFSISLMQLDSNRKFLVECHCENVYFSIPPKSAWTRVVRWTFLNSDNNAAISFRNKVTGIDSATMDMSPKLKKLLYKPR